jgi:uncharacterized protein YbbC (DUF1343 family)
LGLGSNLPFQIFSASWLDTKKAADTLNSYHISGVVFSAITFNYNGSNMPAIHLRVLSPSMFYPVVTEIAVLTYCKKNYPSKFKFSCDGKENRIKMFDKAMGTDLIRRGIEAGWDFRKTAVLYQSELEKFKTKAKKYLIYQ